MTPFLTFFFDHFHKFGKNLSWTQMPITKKSSSYENKQKNNLLIPSAFFSRTCVGHHKIAVVFPKLLDSDYK